MTTIRRLSTLDAQFESQLTTLLAWDSVNDHQLQQTVADILDRVKEQGDAALIDYTHRFDQLSAQTMTELTILPEQLLAAYDGLNTEQRSALATAAERIRHYHSKQKQDSWQYKEVDGTILGQQITPLRPRGYLCAWW
jgi:histidinol dehydrogenase